MVARKLDEEVSNTFNEKEQEEFLKLVTEPTGGFKRHKGAPDRPFKDYGSSKKQLVKRLILEAVMGHDEIKEQVRVSDEFVIEARAELIADGFYGMDSKTKGATTAQAYLNTPVKCRRPLIPERKRLVDEDEE